MSSHERSPDDRTSVPLEVLNPGDAESQADKELRTRFIDLTADNAQRFAVFDPAGEHVVELVVDGEATTALARLRRLSMVRDTLATPVTALFDAAPYGATVGKSTHIMTTVKRAQDERTVTIRALATKHQHNYDVSEIALIPDAFIEDEQQGIAYWELYEQEVAAHKGKILAGQERTKVLNNLTESLARGIARRTLTDRTAQLYAAGMADEAMRSATSPEYRRQYVDNLAERCQIKIESELGWARIVQQLGQLAAGAAGGVGTYYLGDHTVGELLHPWRQQATTLLGVAGGIGSSRIMRSLMTSRREIVVDRVGNDQSRNSLRQEVLAWIHRQQQSQRG